MNNESSQDSVPAKKHRTKRHGDDMTEKSEKRDGSAKMLKKMDTLLDAMKEQQHQMMMYAAQIQQNPKNDQIQREINLSGTSTDPVQSQKFHRDVRRAFQTCTAFLTMGILFLLGYYTYMMVDDYIAPFFWAILFSIILRKPRAILYRVVSPLRNIEKTSKSFKDVFLQKMQFVWMRVFLKPLLLLTTMAVVSYISCFIIGWGCWIPWVWLLAVILLVAVVLSVVLAISGSSSLDSLITTLLVVGFVLCIVLFVVLFVFKAATETADFTWKIHDMVKTTIKDPYWGQLLQEYGVTSEAVDEYMVTGRKYLDDWVTEQGYNLTEIEETLYSFTDSGVETAVESESIPIDAGVESGGFMDYLDLIDFDEIMGYYEAFTETVSVDQLSSIGTTVTDFLLGTGTGIFSIFGTVIAYLLSAVDVLLQFLVFVGALFFFMESDESFVEMTVKIFPVSKMHQKKLANTVQKNIIQIFVSSVLLCFSHGFATLLLYSILSLDFAYSSAFLTGIMTLFPLTSPWLVYMPALAISYLEGGGYWVLAAAISLFLLEQALGAFVDGEIHQMIPGSSPYLTGISLALGVSTFGAQGVLIGPMLVICCKTFFELFCENVAEDSVSLSMMSSIEEQREKEKQA